MIAVFVIICLLCAFHFAIACLADRADVELLALVGLAVSALIGAVSLVVIVQHYTCIGVQ